MPRAFRSSPRTRLRRALRFVHHSIFHESRGGRAAEIIAWSNSASALAIGAGMTYLAWPRHGVTAFLFGLLGTLIAFVVLRLSLASRNAVWGAAALGTITIGALGGGFAWVFAHVVDGWTALPPIAGALGAIAAGAVPALSYAKVIRLRQDEVQDSLIEPVSVPHSH